MDNGVRNSHIGKEYIHRGNRIKVLERTTHRYNGNSSFACKNLDDGIFFKVSVSVIYKLARSEKDAKAHKAQTNDGRQSCASSQVCKANWPDAQDNQRNNYEGQLL